MSYGATSDGYLKGTERYSGKVVYENALAQMVGQISVTVHTSAEFSTDISTILGTAALNTAMGGTPSHDSSDHVQSPERGEIYRYGYVILSPSQATKQMQSSLLSKPGPMPDNGGILA